MIEFPGWVAMPSNHHDPRWGRLVADRVAPIPGLVTIQGVHDYMRRHMTYQETDLSIWARPADTLRTGTGDCADQAILERALLIAAGFESNRIWFLIAYDRIARIDHAMLVVDDQLLDSRSDVVYPVAEATDFNPIEAFCDDTTVGFGEIINNASA